MKRFFWALLPTLLLTGILVAQADRNPLADGPEGRPADVAELKAAMVDGRALPGAAIVAGVISGFRIDGFESGSELPLGPSLPESPGALEMKVAADADASAHASTDPQENKNQHGMKPCVTEAKVPEANAQTSGTNALPNGTNAMPSGTEDPRKPCVVPVNPYRRFLDTSTPLLLTPKQKGYLAFRDLVDPFNLLTVVGNSAVTIGIDSHTAYGPGMGGFGKNVGYSFLQDATGEFIGTFAICSLFHEDPHYHRMPTARPLRRVGHAIARTVIAQHDDGSLMPNYESLLGYPISAELSNLYVPGVSGNAPSTVARIMTGLATDPIGNLITEFLPDLAKRVHIRVVFVQQIINQVARGGEQQ